MSVDFNVSEGQSMATVGFKASAKYATSLEAVDDLYLFKNP
ncbi:MAG: hypothetical protein ACJ74J_05680 [Blastocatellia bacterium]